MSEAAVEARVDVTVRQCVPEDLTPLCDAIEEACRELGNDGQAEFLKTMALANLPHVRIAVVDDELVGYVLWVPGTTKGDVIGAGTWVDPDFRELGISRALRDAAVHHWRQNGGKYVTGSAALPKPVGIADMLDALGIDSAALASVAALGFEVVGLEVRKAL